MRWQGRACWRDLQETRNPKSEIRKKSQAPSPKSEPEISRFGLGISDLGFASDFGFRTSDLAGMSNPLREILLKLCAREDLTRDEARDAFAHLMSGQATEAQIGGLLVGLAAKGTTVDELVGAAQVMREKAVPVDCDSGGQVVLDTCGTGGDVRGTFNISTAAAIIAAAAGVKVVKHGNRSASGKSGSADVLEKLGLRLELSGPQMQRCLSEANICFAFARNHHPAMKHVAAARSSLGIPTIFNLLGPLTNPARAKHQLLGVFAAELTDRLAAVLRELGSERAWVVHADDGLDEISTLGPTRISELRDGRVTTWHLDAKSLGLPYARLSDLRIETSDAAADALRGIFRGERGPRRDIAVLNAAAALVVAGASPDLPHALALASDAIDSGSADWTLRTLIACSTTD
jgi:anthranilate phosphoribosyltransferase